MLTPSPLALTNLIVAAMGQPWPTTEVGRQAYFAALDFRATEGFNGVPQRHRFTTALPGVEGDWGSDDFTGFSLFAYSEPGNGGSLARQGFSQIIELLALEVGPPNETWGAPDSPACVWLADQLILEMYCHQKGSSSLQIGLGRADLESKTGAKEEV